MCLPLSDKKPKRDRDGSQSPLPSVISYPVRVPMPIKLTTTSRPIIQTVLVKQDPTLQAEPKSMEPEQKQMEPEQKQMEPEQKPIPFTPAVVHSHIETNGTSRPLPLIQIHRSTSK